MLSKLPQARLVFAAGAASLVLVQSPLAYAQASADAAFAASRIDGRTEVEKTIGKCAVSVVGGALVGALLGGSQNRGRGAAIGAGVGAGLCAVMMSVASNQDKERLRQMQLQAANTGAPQTMRWRTSDGHAAYASATATDVVEVSNAKAGEVLKCRRTEMQLNVNGQDSASSDVVCLQGDSWVTLDKLKGEGVDPSKINL